MGKKAQKNTPACIYLSFSITLRHLREGSNLLRLPKDVVESPPPEMFKIHLDTYLCNLV